MSSFGFQSISEPSASPIKYLRAYLPNRLVIFSSFFERKNKEERFINHVISQIKYNLTRS